MLSIARERGALLHGAPRAACFTARLAMDDKLRLKPGQKSACMMHIPSVSITKRRNQVLFFSSAPDRQQREHETARK
jgi:hypothetical protein